MIRLFCTFYEFLRRNCGVPLRIDRATMLKWNSRYLTSFAEQTGNHLLRSVFSTNNFRWVWIVFEDPHGRLLFCFGRIRIDQWLVTCDHLISVFWSTAIVFIFTFPCKTTQLRVERQNVLSTIMLKNVKLSNENVRLYLATPKIC